jgi:hypothetical protein
MKETGVDELLKNFKTLKYMQNSNYQKIFTDFLDVVEEYEIAILGHSLGQTDKTLLSEIIDNEKCKKINVYKRRDLENTPIDLRNEYNKLVLALMRIMKNEFILRKKVVDFTKAEFFG